jgi:hypothetical protein
VKGVRQSHLLHDFLGPFFAAERLAAGDAAADGCQFGFGLGLIHAVGPQPSERRSV